MAFCYSHIANLKVAILEPIKIWNNTFSYLNECTLYVPAVSIEKYKNADIWKDFKEIKPLFVDNDCDLSDLPTDNAYYSGTAFLCERGVLSGSKVDGKVNVNDPLKRAHLAKIAFRGLYSLFYNDVPDTVPSDHYPTVYSDLAEQTDDNEYYRQAARALMYLEYGDGVAPFDRDRLDFNPEGSISRLHTLKALMETFNIKPDVTGTDNPFAGDADCQTLMTANPQKFGYIRRAAQLGIITTQNAQFRPNDDCLRGEAFVMLARIMQKIEAGEIDDPEVEDTDYFEPLNTTLATISAGISMPMGNFSSYHKSSFAMNGVMPLTFTHSYNSYNTTLPEVFFGARQVDGADETCRPLGPGWSHNYHAFITQVGQGADTRAIVHWGGGNIDVYKSDGTKFVAESPSVRDAFTMEGYEAVITTNKQMVYRFSNQGGTGAMVLYLKSITDRNGNTLTLSYADGQRGTKLLSSVSDGNRQLTFSYMSGTNLLSSVKDPLGREVKFGYTYNQTTDEYMLTTYTDAKGQQTTYEYGDDQQRSTARLLTRIQMPRGNYVENQYDANRRLVQTANGVGGVPQAQTSISVTSNYANGQASTETQMQVEEGGNQATYTYSYNENNMLSALSGADGLNCTLSYDNEQHPQLATGITTNRGSISDIEFDDNGNLLSFTVQADGDTYTKSMTYNSLNCLTSITDANGNTTTYDYDSKGNLTNIHAPEGVNVSMTLDSRGLVTSSTDAMGRSTQYTYNVYGNLTGTNETALGLTTKNTYDQASRLIETEDELGRKKTFIYDVNDNLVEENNALNHTTKYGYDANDNLTAITNAKGGMTTLTYDATTDLLTALSFADATKHYEYYADGMLKTLTKPDGTQLTRTYDGLGRMTSDGVNSYTYDSQMRLKTMTGSSAAITLTYDGMGRIKMVQHDEGEHAYVVQYEFDKNGNVTALHYPATMNYVDVVKYSYDGLNRLTSVSGFGGSISYTYRKDSKLESVSYGNGMKTAFSYDAGGRLTEKTTTLKDGTVVASYTQTIDKVGNIVSQQSTEPIGGIGWATHQTTYSYDNGNHITQAGDISFSFDANGNTTRRGNEQYGWNSEDRMTGLNGTSISFDPRGNISGYGNTRYYVDISGSGNILADTQTDCAYIYGVGLEARRHTDNGNLEYYVTDLRGSVVAIVDKDGNITHRYSYDEYGNVEQMEEQDFNPFRYVGKWGVMYLNDHCYYMRARMYDPTIGRFYSEDPIWSTNLYPYADNNPITGTAPTGYLTQSEYKRRYELIENKISIYTALKDEAAGNMAEANHMQNYKMYDEAMKRRDNAWTGIRYWEQKMAELKKSMDTDISGLGIRHDDVQAPQVDEEYMGLLMGGGLTVTKQQAQSGSYGLNLNSIQGINKMGDCELAIAEFFEQYALAPSFKVTFKLSSATDKGITATARGMKYAWNAAKKTWQYLGE